MVQSLKFLEAGHTRQRTILVDGRHSFRSMTRFPSSVAVIEHAKEGIVLFDTGYSTRFYSATRRLPERIYRWLTPIEVSESDTAVYQLRSQGIAAHDVRHVVLSHLHADHIAGVSDFNRAQLHYSIQEYRSLLGQSKWGRLIHAFLPSLLPDDFEQRHRPAASPLARIPELSINGTEWVGHDLFGDGSLWTVDLPGHTQAHQGLFVRTQNQNYFLLGDAVWLLDSLRAKQYPSRLAQSIFYDAQKYRETFDRLHLLATSSKITPSSAPLQLVPCHCHATLQNHRCASTLKEVQEGLQPA